MVQISQGQYQRSADIGYFANNTFNVVESSPYNYTFVLKTDQQIIFGEYDPGVSQQTRKTTIKRYDPAMGSISSLGQLPFGFIMMYFPNTDKIISSDYLGGYIINDQYELVPLGNGDGFYFSNY